MMYHVISHRHSTRPAVIVGQGRPEYSGEQGTGAHGVGVSVAVGVGLNLGVGDRVEVAVLVAVAVGCVQ